MENKKMTETEHLLSTKKNRERLAESIAQAEKDEVIHTILKKTNKKHTPNPSQEGNQLHSTQPLTLVRGK